MDVGDGRFDFTGSGFGEVINQGTISISDGGFAVLAAPYVENSGVIRADLGTITLAAANANSTVFGSSADVGVEANARANITANSGLAAAGNITLTGGLTVTAVADGLSMTAKSLFGDTAAASVFAVANADALASAFGDITIGGDITVGANATLTGAVAVASGSSFGEGAIRAEAFAALDLLGSADIGVVGNVTVTGTALNTAVATLIASSPVDVYAQASYAMAYARLDMGSFGTAETIDFGGVTTVTAEAELFASADADLSGDGIAAFVEGLTTYADATASADLEASDSVTTGGLTVTGTVLQTASATMTGDAAANVLASNTAYDTAYAYLTVNAPNGNVTINGDVKVNARYDSIASASGGGNAISVVEKASSAIAYASANIDAGSDDVRIGSLDNPSDVDVVARAKSAGDNAEDAYASGTLDIEASDNIEIVAGLGDTLAVAAIVQSDDSATAYATMNLTATGVETSNISIIGDIGVLAGALAPVNEFASGNLFIGASENVDIAFVNVEPSVVTQNLAGDPAVLVQLTQADINALFVDPDSGLPLDPTPPFNVNLGDFIGGSFYGAAIDVSFGGDATVTVCTLAGLCVPIVEEDNSAGEDTAVLVSVLTGSTPGGGTPAGTPGGDTTTGVGTTGGGGEGGLGGIAPAAGESGDFFSTGDGGFGVDSSGTVTFSELAPKPGKGQGNNACGVVLSCPANDGPPPGQSGGDDDDDDT